MEDNEIKIIDNFLNTTEAIMVEKSIEEASWKLSNYPSTVAPHKYLIMKDENTKEYIQFYHQLLDDNGNPSSSNFIFLAEFLKNKLKSIINVNNFFRMKANLQTQCSFSKEEFYNTPHLDRYFKTDKYFNGIYYVNDSDGDTFFFNKVNDKYLINKKVSPKKGRLILFDGNIYHAGRNPIEALKRIIINFNFN
jgi:hypothetical protein